jgi:hypothetical protein
MEKVSGAAPNLTSEFQVSASDDLVQGQDPPLQQENRVYGTLIPSSSSQRRRLRAGCVNASKSGLSGERIRDGLRSNCTPTLDFL